MDQTQYNSITSMYERLEYWKKICINLKIWQDEINEQSTRTYQDKFPRRGIHIFLRRRKQKEGEHLLEVHLQGFTCSLLFPIDFLQEMIDYAEKNKNLIKEKLNKIKIEGV